MTKRTKKDKSDTTRARTRRWQDRFLTALGQIPSVKHACEGANVSRSAVYREREVNDAFREQWEQALENSVDDLVACAFRRALEGSETLLTFLLKAHRSRIYDRRADEPQLAASQAPVAPIIHVTLQETEETRRIKQQHGISN